jgi:hypothetical protein
LSNKSGCQCRIEGRLEIPVKHSNFQLSQARIVILECKSRGVFQRAQIFNGPLRTRLISAQCDKMETLFSSFPHSWANTEPLHSIAEPVFEKTRNAPRSRFHRCGAAILGAADTIVILVTDAWRHFGQNLPLFVSFFRR